VNFGSERGSFFLRADVDLRHKKFTVDLLWRDIQLVHHVVGGLHQLLLPCGQDQLVWGLLDITHGVELGVWYTVGPSI
jgi:hypothetical protein